MPAKLRLGSSRDVLQAARTLIREIAMLARHQTTALQLSIRLPAPRPMKIHVGCGANIKVGWVNIDFHPGADLQLDLRQRLPLPDASASIIYGEHVFEHLDHPRDTESFLAECLRILQPGGSIKLAVPDAGLVVRSYANGDGDGLLEHAMRVGWHPETCRTLMDQVNFAFRQGGEHHYAWDAETLTLVLSAAGFSNARERDFDPSLDTESRRYGGLLVEARKPR